jgi:hypothetical protein
VCAYVGLSVPSRLGWLMVIPGYSVIVGRLLICRGVYFRFGSVRFLSKKVTKPNFKKKKTETGSNRPVSVRFFRAKPVQTSLARFFRFAPFFLVFSVRVRFGFSGSRLKKSKPNRTGRFFQNFNRFFFTVRFFRLFFFLIFSV